MAEVLLIGPDRERAAGIRSLLRQDGHRVVWLRSVETWRERERAVRPDVVVATVGSLDAVAREPGRRPHGFAPPLLLVQRESDFHRDLFLEERLVDRIASPFLEQELLTRIDALVRVRHVVTRHAEAGEAEHGDSGIRQRLGSWIRARLPRSERPTEPYLEVAARLAQWADRRDAFEPGHAGRVASFCEMIADGISMEEAEKEDLMRAAMLHDVGKVGLPVEVLHQRQPLGDSQLRLIRTHPARGAAVLRALHGEDRVARVVLYHHERPDGQGYYGKPADVVPRASRVLAVAEAYDAMTSSRVRPALESCEALAQLQSGKGSGWDTDSVEALVDQLRPRAASIPVALPRADPRH